MAISWWSPNHQIKNQEKTHLHTVHTSHTTSVAAQLGVSDDGPRNGHPLLLAPRDASCALARVSVVACTTSDKFGRVGCVWKWDIAWYNPQEETILIGKITRQLRWYPISDKPKWIYLIWQFESWENKVMNRLQHNLLGSGDETHHDLQHTGDQGVVTHF